MLKGSKDFRCALLGCVGNDDYGCKIKNALKDLNVDGLLETHKTKKSSRCGVGIHKKERCLLPEINASNELSLDFVKSHQVNK
jgi:sugar/nucleoside kinase (ribokinase family)